MHDPAALSPLPRRRMPSPAAMVAPLAAPRTDRDSPGDALHVRSAMAADLPAVTEIQAAAMRSGGAASIATPLDLRQVTALRERLAVQGYPCLVAVRGGTVLGFAFAQPFGQREGWRMLVEAIVAVHPDARGEQVGRALLAALIGACEARGFRQMLALIEADASGADAAALHEALGFERAGVLRGAGLRLGVPVDALMLQRPLAAGSAARSAA